MSSVFHLSYLHEKQMLMKFFVANPQTCANLSSELMLLNCTRNRSVNPCRPIFIYFGIQLQRRGDSRLIKRRPVALKIRLFPIFNKHDRNVKLKTYTLQAGRRKMTASVLIGFYGSATLFLESWVFSIIFLSVENCIHPSLKKRSNLTGRGELNASRRHYVQRNGLMLLECGDANGGDCKQRPILLNFPCRRSLAAEQPLEEIEIRKSFGYEQCDIEVPENLRSKIC